MHSKLTLYVCMQNALEDPAILVSSETQLLVHILLLEALLHITCPPLLQEFHQGFAFCRVFDSQVNAT